MAEGKPTIGRLAVEWSRFAEHGIPAGAPAIQTREMKRAFYAGAGAMLDSFAGLVGPDEDENQAPTEVQVQAVEDLHQELDTFMRNVRRGKA